MSKNRPLRREDPEERALLPVEPEWSEEELLRKDGLFRLKDVAFKLNISSADLKKKAFDLEDEGHSAWEVMGIARIFQHWIVRMRFFADYFRGQPFNRVREVEEFWDGNDLLSEKGLFYLANVCEKIPFKAHQIRHQVRGNRNARQEFGVWKDPFYQTYVVEMEVFAAWIKTLWLAR